MTKFTSLIAIICTVAAGTALAGSHSGAAVGHGTSATDMMPLSETHIVMHTSSDYEKFDVSPGHPLEGANGPCFGVAEIKAGWCPAAVAACLTPPMARKQL